jgi:SAM-dependent methyltransferase
MTDPQRAVDVDRLVEELRDRVAAQRAAGAYAVDPSALPLELPPPEPPVRFRPERGYSSKPLVGRPLTLVKQAILRLLIHVFDDLAEQTSSAIDADRRALAEAEGRLLTRVEDLERTLDRLALAPRLARLERTRRTTESAADAGVVPAAALADASAPPLDYLAFEARFRGSEEVIRERQGVYPGILGGCRRVVDLGCGRGELLELLTSNGVDAYGVELNADFVDLVAEKGLTVIHEDALAHLGRLEPGAVDGIVASHVVEHLPPAVVSALIATAWERLPGGGVLVMETPNPESLVAGSINFHRDPTHLRPIHPDTLAFMCQSTGFGDVTVRRMSPMLEGDILPRRNVGEGPLAEHLDAVVSRLNDLLYGFQDYAVIARK